MATERAKRAVAKIIENHGNISRAMLEVGYSPNTAKKPSNLTNSKGYKELMTEHQKEMAKYGLTKELIAQSLTDDIRDKPKKRVHELRLGADILGMKENDDGGQVFVPIQIVIHKQE